MNCEWRYTCGHKICIPEFCKEYEPQEKTNLDWIREASEDELAKLIYDIWTTGFCAFHSGDRLPSISATKEWLRQPKDNEP